MLYKILSFLHKLLGVLLCGLFFLWFATGIVMIYHGFPRASADKQLELMQPLVTADLPAADELPGILADLKDRTISALTFEPVEDTLGATLRSWCTAPVARIDTLNKLDQWIPFGRNREELPIYKYHFDDPERHQLYLGSKTGRVLQFTSHKERVWAWVGAIPHWVYFTKLRQEQQLWLNSVKWAAGIGCIMIILGFVFGIFAITFAFSGMMSLADMPEFLKKAPKTERRGPGGPPPGGRPGFPGQGPGLALDRYTLDYRNALAAYPGTKTLAWSDFKGHPYYTLTMAPKERVFIDAAANEVKPFVITEEMVRRDMERQYCDSIPYTIELIDKFDNDYHTRKVKETSLPVYRVIVDDYMHTRWYYNPATLESRRIDDDTRTRNWLYHKLHTLDFKFLTDHPVLWNIVMYALMLGGTVLSVTGVVLSVKWIVRGIRKLFRKKQTKR